MADLDTENDLIIATTASRILVRIKPDGTLIYGPEYTPDEAADVFWQALARRRADAEVKEVFARHVHALLLVAGQADLANQSAREHEAAVTLDPKASQAAKMKAHLDLRATDEALNEAAQRLVELGRKIALRGAEDRVTPDSRQVN